MCIASYFFINSSIIIKVKFKLCKYIYPVEVFFLKKRSTARTFKKRSLKSNKSIINHIFTFNINKNSLLLMALQDSCQSNIENSKNRYKALSLLTRCARETQILNTKGDNVK
jgi:hypothetical protein